MATPRSGAGATIADIDSDGRVDVVASNAAGLTLAVLVARCVG